MNDNFKLDISYIAGLFDGEGSIYYKQIIEKRKTRKNPTKIWKIRMEMSVPDKNVTELVHETLGCGTLREKKVARKKKQWRWQCSHRDALYVCKLLWPHTAIKLHKIEQIINHYEPDIQELNDNIISLALEREKKKHGR